MKSVNYPTFDRLKQHSQLLMDDFMEAILGYFHSVFVMKEVKNTHGVPLLSGESN